MNSFENGILRLRRGRMIKSNKNTQDSTSDPLVLVGSARSGTTLVSRAIAAHPRFTYWEEPNLFLYAYSLMPGLLTLVKHRLLDSQADVMKAGRKGMLRCHLGSNAVVPSNSEVFNIACFELRCFLESIMVPLLQKSDALLFFEKTPDEMDVLPFINSLFPKAKVIHMVRDGRDVVASEYVWRSVDRKKVYTTKKLLFEYLKDGLKLFFKSYRGKNWRKTLAGSERAKLFDWFEENYPIAADWPSFSMHPEVMLAKRWANKVSTCADYGRSQMQDRYYEVHYEDFVRNPEPTLQDVMSFTGIPFSENQSIFLKEGMSGGVSISSIGNYKKRLSKKQLIRITPIIDTIQKQLGYQ